MDFHKTGSGNEYRVCKFKDGHTCSAKALADSSCLPAGSNKQQVALTPPTPPAQKTPPTPPMAVPVLPPKALPNQTSPPVPSVAPSVTPTPTTAPTAAPVSTTQVASNSYTNDAAQACVHHGGTTDKDDPSGTCTLQDGTSCPNSEIFKNGKCGSGTSLGNNLLNDGDMEAGDTGAWRVLPGNSAVPTKEPGTRTGGSGSYVLRISKAMPPTSTSGEPLVAQIILTQGKRYKITGYTRSVGDGKAIPTLLINNSGNEISVTGNASSTDWQPFDIEITAGAAMIALESDVGITNNLTGYTGYTEWDDLSVREINP